MVSLATTPHALTYDQVVLLPVLIQTSVWILNSRRLFLAGIGGAIHLLINGLALLLNISRVTDFWYIWMVPTLLLIYLGLRNKLPVTAFAGHKPRVISGSVNHKIYTG